MRPIQESGKRKTAIARATVTDSREFSVCINKVPVQAIEPRVARMKVIEAIRLFTGEKLDNIQVDVDVEGGGVIAQCDAARIAITKALNSHLKKKRVTKKIKEYDKTLLSGDSRRKEPKKWGGHGARARFQKSYR